MSELKGNLGNNFINKVKPGQFKKNEIILEKHSNKIDI